MDIIDPTQMRFAEALEHITLLVDAPRWQCTDCGFTASLPLHAYAQKCPGCRGDQYGHRASGINALQVRVGRTDYPVLHPLQLGDLDWHYRLRASRPADLDTYRANGRANEPYAEHGKRGAWGGTLRQPWAALLIAGGASHGRAQQLPGTTFKELPLVRIGVDEGAEREAVDIAFSTRTSWAPSRIDWRSQGIRRLLVAAPNVSPSAVRLAESARWILPEAIDPHTSALRERWDAELGAIADEVQLGGGGSSLFGALDWVVRSGAVVVVIVGAETGAHLSEINAGLTGALAAWCVASGVLVIDESGDAFAVDERESAYACGFRRGTEAVSRAAREGLQLPQSAWVPKSVLRGTRLN